MHFCDDFKNFVNIHLKAGSLNSISIKSCTSISEIFSHPGIFFNKITKMAYTNFGYHTFGCILVNYIYSMILPAYLL